ncbi:ComEC/Rec2 family competence protein [Paludisphaera soli]|uniref:ComEC/Rec2 family competence protein n=1 Tax=Paludisphaera soli TaxID=2712865 RepID=UPI0013E9D82A|nr:ComEC/Rec2 family competence protein [Paludisphaera soli]
MAPVLAALVVGTVLDRRFAPWGSAVWSSWLVAFAAVALLTSRRPRISGLALAAALAAAGGAHHHLRWFDVPPDDLAAVLDETPAPAWVRGHVEEVVGLRRREGRSPGDDARERTRFTLRIAAVSDGSTFRPATGRADVFVQGDRSDLVAGQPVQVAGRLARVAGPLNPGEFDRRAHLQARGIRLTMGVDEPSGVMPDPEGSWSWRRGWLGSLRAWSRDRLVEGLDPAVAPLASALVLGLRDEIDAEVDDAFARTGTTHLLAVSGLQLQVLAWAIGMVLVVVGVPRRLRYALVALSAIWYAMLVGCSPSVTRSMVMTVSFCAALAASRQARAGDALALAGTLTILFNPAFLFDVGCQLSFLAVVALIWLTSPATRLLGALRARAFGPPDPLDELESWNRTPLERFRRFVSRQAAQLAMASAIVWAVAAPLSALRFHLISPVGILLNVPLVPLTSLALLAGALKLTMAAAGLWPAAWALGRVVGGLLGLSEVVVKWGAAVPGGHWYTPGPPERSVFAFYVLLAVAVYLLHAGPRREGPRKGWMWARGIAWGLVLGFLPGWTFSGIGRRPATLEADVLAVGHGLAIVVQTPEGKTFLYDCGKMDDPGVGRRIVAPALWSRGVSRIDAVFLSHADQDHFDGLPDLLDRFAVAEVVVPPDFVGRDNPAAMQLMATLGERGVPVRTLAAPAVWRSGTTRFEAVHPPAGWSPGAADNARSLVLDVEHRGRRLLLTGDLEQLGLSELLARPEPEPPIDVLLAPHHGGRAANPPRLFEWARPRVVAVSQKPPVAGSADALTPLEGGDIVILRTWKAGAILLRWSPEGIVARGFREPERDTEGRPG